MVIEKSLDGRMCEHRLDPENKLVQTYITSLSKRLERPFEQITINQLQCLKKKFHRTLWCEQANTQISDDFLYTHCLTKRMNALHGPRP